jgi:hypothetical protein
MTDDTTTKIAVHEAVCAERYAAIEKSFLDGDKRMTRIEYLLYVLIAAVLLGPGFAGELVKKVLGLELQVKVRLLEEREKMLKK